LDIGCALAQCRQALDDAGLGIAGVRLVQCVVRSVIDQNQRR
jgi:hypothetical protein